MKQSLSLGAIIVAATLSNPAFAGDPAEGSPEASVTQVVGGGEMRVDYSRPGVKGRTIWGDLVPYGKVWRAGANDKTAFRFEDDVVISGRLLPSGTYSFYAIPEEQSWTLIFNSDWEGHGTSHNEEADVLRFKVTPETAPHEEWLRYGFDALEDGAATAYLRWADKRVAFRVDILPGFSDDEFAVLQVLDGLLLAAKEQRIEDIMGYFSDDFDTEALAEGDQMANFLRDAAAQGLLETVEPDFTAAKVEVDGDSATVADFSIDTFAGRVPLQFEMIKVDGQWRISALTYGDPEV